LEIKVLDWDKYNNVAGLNWLIGSQLSLLITGSPTAKNNKKICTDSLPLKKTTYYYRNE